MIKYTPPHCWIWQQPNWPQFLWRLDALLPSLSDSNKHLGVFLEPMGSLPSGQDSAAALDALLQNIVASTSIESEVLNTASVRSSLARRLGVSDPMPVASSSKSEGLAQLMLDAIQNCQQPLTLEQLMQWHRSNHG